MKIEEMKEKLDWMIQYQTEKLSYFLDRLDNDIELKNIRKREIVHTDSCTERRIIASLLSVAESFEFISNDEWNHCVDTIYCTNNKTRNYDDEECIIREERKK